MFIAKQRLIPNVATATVPKPEIPFNHKTFEAYTKEGLDPLHAYVKRRHDRFAARFNPEKAPLQIIITAMARQAKTEYDDKGNAVKKDYLTYSVEYRAKDWLENELRESDVHGAYQRPTFKVKLELDPVTGEHIQKKEHSGEEDVFYIELTDKNRKKTIEEIINKSTGTIIDGIKFYGKFGNTAFGFSFRCDLYTYDQFINSSIEELEKLGRKEGGPQGNAPRSNKDKKSYMC